MVALHRIMTLKSRLGFGKYGKYTLQKLFDLRRESEILQAYYYISNIDFDIEVLVKLKLDTKYQIPKPGINKDMYKTTLKALYSGQYKVKFERNKSDLEKQMTRETKLQSNRNLQARNQGH